MTTAERSTRSSYGSKIGSQTQINTDKFAVLTPTETQAILLPDGWHSVQNAEKVEFAIEEAHSPADVQKTYTCLRFSENGNEMIVPLRQVLGYSNQTLPQGRSSQQFGQQNR